MASVCPNAASAEANYAGPMPIIGLYIAAATAVCFLSILLDVIFAFLDKKPWIPVRFFSLNSFTLTVMGVSTKLAVDLTTYMPGLDGQLSKLCSTVFICICMGFLMPSLGTMKGSDRYANLTSLTILVVTIIVNVCMQISSGVIFSFVVEHIVIMIFMFILLCKCWSSILNIEDVLIESAMDLRRFFKNSKSVNGKINRLESCYRRSYIWNPQVLMCEYSHCITIGLLSFLSFTILLQSLLRATFYKEFQICMEYSDYKWSIWVVIPAQFLTCALGCLSITWRWISIAFHMEPNIKFSLRVRGFDFSEWKQLAIFKWKFNTIVTSDWDIHFVPLNQLCSGALKCFRFLQPFILFLCFGTQVISNFIDEFVLFVIHILRRSFPSAPTETPDDEFDDLSGFKYKKELRKWLVSKSKENLQRWKKKNESNVVSELCPSMLPYPSSHLLQKMEGVNKFHLLVIVLLSAREILPSNLIDSLLKAFDQTFEVICFVDEYLDSNELILMFKLRVARYWWMTRDINSDWYYNKVVKPALQMFPAIHADEESQPLEFQRALNIFEHMMAVDDEYQTIGEEISRRARELNTIGELYNVILQFVLSIMHFYLKHFPASIFQYLMNSPVDEIETRTKLTVKLYSKLEGLEDKVSWQPLPMRPQVAAPSKMPAEVPTRDQRSDEIAELSEALVETTITEEITKIC